MTRRSLWRSTLVTWSSNAAPPGTISRNVVRATTLRLHVSGAVRRPLPILPCNNFGSPVHLLHLHFRRSCSHLQSLSGDSFENQSPAFGHTDLDGRLDATLQLLVLKCLVERSAQLNACQLEVIEIEEHNVGRGRKLVAEYYLN